MSKQERPMPLREWFMRMGCATTAFGCALLGLGGIAIFGATAVLPHVEGQRYGMAVCTAVALFAAFFGIGEMALWINRRLLFLLNGSEPLDRKENR
ncbi:hypothetical protein FX016_23275 [Cupriavidus gilardii]|nr:hypothetical protein FX016_23275 [Cupriavidus gilardii]